MTAILIAAALIAIGPLIGFFATRRQRAGQGHAESELRFSPLVTGMSATAAGNSAFILIGAVGLGYTMGLSAMWLPLGYFAGDIVFWYLIAPRLVRRVQDTGVDTISELIAYQTVGRSGLPLRVAALVTITAVGLFCLAQFVAVGRVASEFLDLPFNEVVAGALLLGLMSVSLGGLGSSMLVNVYQALLMLGAALLLVVFVVGSLLTDGTLTAAGVGSAQYQHLLDPFYGFTPLTLGLFILTFFLSGLLYATCNPQVLSRITKGNISDLPRLRWIYMGFTQVLWQLMTLTGVALALLGGGSPSPDSAGMLYAQAAMPPIILGVFFAGVVAASMSTAEAQLLVVANSLAMDFVPKRFERLTEGTKKAVLIALRLLVALTLYVIISLADLDLVSSLVIQSGTILFAAFAIPAATFIFRIPTDRIVMALTIIAGAGAASFTRAITSWPPGHEIFVGLGAAIIVIAIGTRLARATADSKG